LEELRNLHQPLDREGLDKFNHEYVEVRNYKLKEINKKR